MSNDCTPPLVLTLSAGEVRHINELAAVIAGNFTDPDDPQLLHTLAWTCGELPRRVRAEIRTFLDQDHNGALLIRGFDVDNAQIGPTPLDDHTSATLSTEDVRFMLIACSFGQPFGFSVYREGNVLHDICSTPSKQHL
jgi:L-asparagine oxygenase